MKPVIRAMTERDIDDVVKIHLASFKNFFLSSLGTNFLKLLYTSIIEDESGIALIAEINDSTCGFVTGTDKSSGFYKRLISRKVLLFALASVVPSVKNPRIIPRLIRSLRLPQITAKNQKCGTLMSLAVLPDIQGYGIGKILVNYFVDECDKRQLEIISLTTDAFENDRVNSFYKKMGFVIINIFTTPEGRQMNEYQISLLDKALNTLGKS